MTRPFTPDEREDMREILASVSIELPPSINLEWDDTIIRRGVLGAFRWWRPDVITVADIPHSLKELASTVTHELVHRDQYLRNKAVYLVLLAPGLRHLTLEREARRVERHVDELLHLPPC